MTTPFSKTRIEFHILQSFPVTCLNRDDVGAPKTAVIGGSTRARVSSQCWKRAVRQEMAGLGVKLASRTKHSAVMFSKACLSLGANQAQADTCGEKMSELLAKDTLLFISETEANAFAHYALSLNFDESKFKEKEMGKIAKAALTPATDAMDIALFGRMVAKVEEMNVEASASFSHAISTHKISNDIDFFTALDDHPADDEKGSSHMGTIEFNSATYYRYISLDVGELSRHMSADDVEIAIKAFTHALYLAVPSARQTTQSGASAWDFARVVVRKGQRVQVPFETAVKAKDGGFLAPSIDALTNHLNKIDKLSGSLSGKKASFDWGVDEAFNIDDLVDGIILAIK
jgi:CRISPR system Cascade subunit CasC